MKRRLLSNNCYIFFSYKALQNINNLPCIRCVFTAEKRCFQQCVHCYKFAVNFAKGILPNRTGFLPDNAWIHRVRVVHSPLMDFRRSRFRRPCRRFDAPLVLPVFPMIVQGGFGTAQAVRDFSTDDEKVLAELGEGACFGERALLKDEPRFATIVATSALRAELATWRSEVIEGRRAT